MNTALPRRYTEAEYRNNRVREVLLTSGKVLGPTEIARRINEDWCGGRFCDPSSAAIVPILRRIGATRHPGGMYSLDQP